MAIETSHPGLLLRQLFDRDTFTYTYLLVDPETQEGAIIDAVKEQFDRDLQLIKELGIELLYAIETHAHADHITSAGMLRQNTGAKIVFGEAAGIQGIDLIVKDGDKLPLGRHSIEVIATPGHTSGCTSYYIDGIVFTGDTLLIRGCGRTDFQQGDAKTLYDNVTNRLFILPDETLV
ncbi:MAG: MBL fold metallo-hydrolase, partial [Porticoccaceae bacterium]|nr:MBL fold metallo-hydrolase [Porticoccaceae bacterium]